MRPPRGVGLRNEKGPEQSGLFPFEGGSGGSLRILKLPDLRCYLAEHSVKIVKHQHSSLEGI
jgi:hypothetical protein